MNGFTRYKYRDPDGMRAHLDEEIERFRVSLSDSKTRLDTLPPMAHLFDSNIRKELDDKVLSLGVMLQDCRTRRNTLASIFRLPEEVFINIFMFAREFPSVKHRNKQFPQLAICTYICRHWRNLILASPTLWNNINLSWPPCWVAAWFARSQNARLDITMSIVLNSTSFKTTTQLISTNSFRLSRMQIVMSSIEDWLIPLQYTTPCLKFLEIQVLQGLSGQLTFPHILFGGQGLPLLRTFGFYGPHSIWTSPLLLNLTSLKVDQYSHPHRPRVSLWNILESLQLMTQMEHLHIEGEAFPDDFENPENISVPLPLMSTIRLRGPILRVAALLSYLSMPTTVSIGIYSTTDSDGSEALDILFQFLSSHFQHTRVNLECALTFEHVKIQQHGQDIKVWVNSNNGAAPFILELPLCSMFVHTVTVLSNILPLYKARTLCVSGYDVTQELWDGLLGRMQEIEVLDMGHFACSQFPYSIARLTNYLPVRLRTVRLYLIDFRRPIVQDPAFLEVFVECLINLRQRQQMWRSNSGLKVIELHRCVGIDEEWVRKLRFSGFEISIHQDRGEIAERIKGLA